MGFLGYCSAAMSHHSEEDKCATTNAQNRLVFFFLFSFILFYSFIVFYYLKKRLDFKKSPGGKSVKSVKSVERRENVKKCRNNFAL